MDSEYLHRLMEADMRDSLRIIKYKEKERSSGQMVKSIRENGGSILNFKKGESGIIKTEASMKETG